MIVTALSTGLSPIAAPLDQTLTLPVQPGSATRLGSAKDSSRA